MNTSSILINMTSIEDDNALGFQPASYYDGNIHQGLDYWPMSAFPELPTISPSYDRCSDDIERLYTELHNCIDQVAAKLSGRTPSRLGQIKEQNRKVVDKLKVLESAITLNSGSCVIPSTWAPGLDPRRDGGKKKRRVSQPTRPKSTNASIPHTPKEAQARSDGRHDKSGSRAGRSSDRPRGDAKLTTKLLLIGNHEARIHVAEYAAQMKTPESENTLPNAHRFSNMSQITDMSDFLRLITNLGLAIESSIFGEQNSRIRKRIALAHFYHAYTLAQNNPELFLSWCDDQGVQCNSMLPKGGTKSVVQHRFAELIFSRAQHRGEMCLARPFDNGDDAKRKIAKIQMWRKIGKKWAQMIQRFGCGILLLLPTSLSDEE
ncbi:hypothetical protein SCUP515_03992 [Seiridium cupressi]